MFSISRITHLLTLSQTVLAEQESRLAEKPTSRFRQMLVYSTRARIDELTRELVEEKELRALEVIEIRLIGEKAHFGSLPMQLVGQLTASFEEMLVQVGRFVKHGSKGQDSLQSIRGLLDVRLNRISSGSTRLFVTAKTSPDLFGDSLAEECIQRTFNLLKVESANELTERAGEIGKGGVQNLNRFLKTLHESDLEASLNWQTPFDTTLEWEGTRERIGLLQHSLDNIIEEEAIEISFQGEVLMESIRGQARFEVKDYSSGQIFKGFVSQEVLPELLALHVGETCKGVVSKTTRRNLSSTEERHSFELIQIEPSNDPRLHSDLQLALAF
ncbi:hypothetical protein [Persicitalea sp.]|uniref:hypothetical protein n=1 Tax=Persicitalea sp. TaxID=3100273 RepID=UPI0035949343